MSAARGFRYALDPVRQQRQWKLEAAQTQLAKLQAERAACAKRIAELEAACARDAAAAAQAWLKVRDPASKTAALAFLARLQREAQSARDEAQRIDRELGEAREECAARQRESEAMEQHRDDALRAHRTELQRRASVQADADWSARGHSMGDGT